MKIIENVVAEQNSLRIKFETGAMIVLEDLWLRDHCRCSICYHADTYQRAQHILDIPETEIESVQYDANKIIITWDDNHKSIYMAEFLVKFEYKTWVERRKFRPLVWRGKAIANKINIVPVAKFLNSVDGAREVFQSLLDFGVALIEGVKISVEGTEAICKALGGVQHTIFGGMWKFTTKVDHADTAYTNLPLAVHNDNTYFTEAAGLQILHCLEHSNGSGGETLLVDGFYGANKLKQEYPDDFKFLTTFNLEAEYLEEGHHHSYSAPIIRLDSDTDELIQIRFNVYDRAPMAFKDKKQCRDYYRSIRNLSRYYQDAENQWQFKLKPGLTLVMDNFRVLHGRTAFTGNRVLCGSYVARSDWLDRARNMGLIS